MISYLTLILHVNVILLGYFFWRLFSNSYHRDGAEDLLLGTIKCRLHSNMTYYSHPHFYYILTFYFIRTACL